MHRAAGVLVTPRTDRPNGNENGRSRRSGRRIPLGFSSAVQADADRRCDMLSRFSAALIPHLLSGRTAPQGSRSQPTNFHRNGVPGLVKRKNVDRPPTEEGLAAVSPHAGVAWAAGCVPIATL